MKRAYYDKEPLKLEAVGNGNYLYHWDIKEETTTKSVETEYDEDTMTQYSCNEATIIGEPTYDKCIEAVIRNEYSAEQELALINKFNSFNQGIIEDSSIVEEYKNYLTFVANTKDMVKKDLGMFEL